MGEIIDVEFGKRLKKLRNEKNLSEKELAEILDVQKSTLKRWEEGITTLSLNKLILICNYFNVRCNLVGLED